VLSGRGLSEELIICPEESYRLWRVTVCDLETSWMRRPWPTGGLLCQKQTPEVPISRSHQSQFIQKFWICSLCMSLELTGFKCFTCAVQQPMSRPHTLLEALISFHCALWRME